MEVLVNRGELSNLQRARRRFLAALALFLAWVALLGGLAFLSASRPGANPAAPGGR